MRKYTVLLFCLLLVSCKEMRAIMAEDTAVHKGKKMYFTDPGKSLIKISLNNVEHEVIFDTGAGATMIFNPRFELAEKSKINERTVYGFQKQVKLKAYDYSIDSLTSELWTTRHKYLYIKERLPEACSRVEPADGLLGSIIESDDILEINYDQGYLQYVNDFDRKSYTALDAKFSAFGTFSVNIEVNGIRDNFLFDTGNKTVTLLSPKVYKNVGEKKYTIKTLSKSVGTDSFTANVDIYKVPVSFGNDLKFDLAAGIDPKMTRSMLSFNFIKKFNWFIDRKNKKVYCRPIDLAKLTEKRELEKKDMIFASAINGKLLIAYSNFDSSFEVGSEIVSVDGEKVTSENLCATMERLNNSQDWPGLNIVAITPEKAPRETN